MPARNQTRTVLTLAAVGFGGKNMKGNYLTIFYGMARANRFEQADPHDTPILDFIERAKWHCKEIFGPKGIETTYGAKKYIDQGPSKAENPHGIENLSTVPNTINEMLCMGHKGVLRIFPVWPKSKDASFVNIRCRGAFLVSGELKGGKVVKARILSEKGRACTVVNPWPEKSVQLVRNGEKAEVLSGERVTFKTTVDEVIELTVDG